MLTLKLGGATDIDDEIEISTGTINVDGTNTSHAKFLLLIII